MLFTDIHDRRSTCHTQFTLWRHSSFFNWILSSSNPTYKCNICMLTCMTGPGVPKTECGVDMQRWIEWVTASIPQNTQNPLNYGQSTHRTRSAPSRCLQCRCCVSVVQQSCFRKSHWRFKYFHSYCVHTECTHCYLDTVLNAIVMQQCIKGPILPAVFIQTLQDVNPVSTGGSLQALMFVSESSKGNPQSEGSCLHWTCENGDSYN